MTTTIVTNEGKSLVGFITAKTKDSITLLMAEGKQATITNGDIDETLAEIATGLGVQYAQHLATLFKSKSGLTPGEYRRRYRR